MRLEFVLVFGLEELFLHVQVEIDFLVAFELHDQEGVPCLALSQRRIQSNGDECVHIVGLG